LKPWLALPPPSAGDASKTVVSSAPAPAVPLQFRLFARLQWPVVALVALVAVGGAVIGSLFAHGSDPGPRQAATAVGDDVSMALPLGWDQRDVGAAGTLEAGPVRMPDAGVKVKVSDQEPDRQTGAEPVKLGGFETWRTEGVSLRGGETANLYVAPTTEGSLIITCFAPAARSAALLPGCERVAATISLHSGRPLALDSTIASERRVATVAENLASERAAGRETLAAVGKRGGQARAATSLARLYDGAARKLRGEPVAPALSATAANYRQLAQAAKGGDDAGWSTARKEVDRQEAAVDRALKKAAAGP